MTVFIINFKNYPEAAGPRALKLSTEAQKAARRLSVDVVLAPPTPMLGAVAEASSLQVFSQSLSSAEAGKSTGWIVPEAVKAAGASGTLLNHSESRLRADELRALVPRARRAGLKVCVCAGSTAEAVSASKLGPEYLAIEPPELVGTGVAVSRARPEVVSGTVAAARGSGYRGMILCGAGITSREDVERAVELGVDGVLVSSAVVLAKDWGAKISDLASPLSGPKIEKSSK